LDKVNKIIKYHQCISDSILNNHLTDKENYYNIKKISSNCLDNAIYNYNENPLPIKTVKDLLYNTRLNAVYKALYYYILYIKK